MLNKLRHEEKGFTLIELLVVVLIIGILAAIALPTFLGQQEKGQDSSAKSNARNLVSHVESCYADTQDYTGCDQTAELTNTGLTITADATAQPLKGEVKVTASAAGTYTVMAKSSSDKNYFAINRTAGGSARVCGLALTDGGGVTTTSNSGSCKSGTW